MILKKKYGRTAQRIKASDKGWCFKRSTEIPKKCGSRNEGGEAERESGITIAGSVG